MWNFEIDDERQAIEACASMPETTFRAMRGAFDGTALRAFRDVPNRRAYEAVIVAHIAAGSAIDAPEDCDCCDCTEHQHSAMPVIAIAYGEAF